MSEVDTHMEAAGERIAAHSVPGPGGCRLWIGGCNDAGYGYTRVAGRSTGVHRVAYLVHGGQLLPGEAVHHRCGVRHCVNPSHLSAVTISANTAEALATRALRARIKTLEQALRSIAPAHPLLANAGDDLEPELDHYDYDTFDAHGSLAA
ncbi:HNH endonuclease signature motif containing protein [Crossiella sp. NPDC003009]